MFKKKKSWLLPVEQVFNMREAGYICTGDSEKGTLILCAFPPSMGVNGSQQE